MGPKARGRILFWEGASMWILSAPPGEQYPQTAPHAHHALQLSLALGGRIDFVGDNGRIGGDAIAVAPDARHRFQGTGLVAHVFVASEGEPARAIMAAVFARESIAPLPSERLGDLPARLRAQFEDRRCTDAKLIALGRELIAALAGEAPARPTDRRIRKLLAWADERLDESLTLDDAATVVGLSPGRTRHLFVEQTGLPFRTYLLWLRLVRAVETFAAGESLTEAAHAAGFADSAHLSRTFRRMFGIAAATLDVSPT